MRDSAGPPPRPLGISLDPAACEPPRLHRGALCMRWGAPAARPPSPGGGWREECILRETCREPLVYLCRHFASAEECAAVLEATRLYGKPLAGWQDEIKYDMPLEPMRHPGLAGDACATPLESLLQRIDALCGSPRRAADQAPRVHHYPPGRASGRARRGFPAGLHVDTNGRPFRYATAILYLTTAGAELLRGGTQHSRNLADEDHAPLARQLEDAAADRQRGLHVTPEAGKLALFFTRGEDGEVDAASWHGGAGVGGDLDSDGKWAAAIAVPMLEGDSWADDLPLVQQRSRPPASTASCEGKGRIPGEGDGSGGRGTFAGLALPTVARVYTLGGQPVLSFLVLMWRLAPLRPVEKGAAVVLRLGGAAREFADELDAQILQQGQILDLQDGLGPRQVTGLAVLLRALARNYALEAGEDAIRAMAEMMAFSVQQHETIDVALNRFQVLKSRAIDHGLNPGPSGWAWMLMTGLRVQPDEWLHLLGMFDNRLPQDEEEFSRLIQSIRRRGHVLMQDGIMRAAERAVRIPGATAHPAHADFGKGRHFMTKDAVQGFFPTFGEINQWGGWFATAADVHKQLALEDETFDGCEALLVDPGAHDNLTGSEWFKRVSDIWARRGVEVEFKKMDRPIGVEGVGNNADACINRGRVPLALAGGEEGSYDAPIVPNSSVPALLGNKALRRNRAIVDCFNGILYFIGPGDHQLLLPPGSKEYQLELSQSGHWMLPVTEFEDQNTGQISASSRLGLRMRSAVMASLLSLSFQPRLWRPGHEVFLESVSFHPPFVQVISEFVLKPIVGLSGRPLETVPESVAATSGAKVRQHYPTEARIKQKQREAEFGKKTLPKKMDDYEKHWDDCGDDLSSILVDGPDLWCDDYSYDVYRVACVDDEEVDLQALEHDEEDLTVLRPDGIFLLGQGWLSLRADTRVVSAVFHQCQVGLVEEKSRLPVKKDALREQFGQTLDTLMILDVAGSGWRRGVAQLPERLLAHLRRLREAGLLLVLHLLEPLEHAYPLIATPPLTILVVATCRLWRLLLRQPRHLQRLPQRLSCPCQRPQHLMRYQRWQLHRRRHRRLPDLQEWMLRWEQIRRWMILPECSHLLLNVELVQPGQRLEFRAMKLLHSKNNMVIRRTLRKLHIRMWHAPALRLKEMLIAAGAPQEAIDLIQIVCDTCPACRAWHRPGKRPIATSRVITDFNQDVQIDLLFWKTKIVMHMLDTLVRFSVAAIIPDRNTGTIIGAVTHYWFRLFGAPAVLTSDREGALDSDEARSWASRWQCKLNLRPRGAHARMVERHHELLRHQLHLVDEQCTRDGTPVPDEAILDECVLAKNCMISISGNITPYKVVFGRTIPMLTDLEPASATALEDQDDGIDGISRHIHRLREVAIAAVVGASAQQRMDRALQSRTRPAGECQNLQLGDLVDIWRDPPNKDVSGWRGPATVVNVNRIQEGVVDVQWQSRTLSCRLADVRHSLSMDVMVATEHYRQYWELPLTLVQEFAESIEKGSVTLACVNTSTGWKLSRHCAKYPIIFHAMLHVASCDLRLQGCSGGRLGHGAKDLECMPGVDETLFIFWKAAHVYFGGQIPAVELTSEDIEGPISIEFSRRQAWRLGLAPDKIAKGQVLVMNIFKTQASPVIERDLNNLSAAEIRQHHDLVVAAKLKELKRWVSRGVVERMPKKDADNRIDSRWVIKWKIIEGSRDVKGRLTVRGFKDQQKNEKDRMRTAAGTASRWGQRVICSIAAQHGWTLWSLDVSMAFLRGKTFEELAERFGFKMRSLQFDLPPDGAALLKQIEGFEDFNEVTETLNMKKPGFGTNDAPWAWQVDLSDTLRELGFFPTEADRQLWLMFDNALLVAVLGTHVDDLKGACSDETREWIFAKFREKYEDVTVNLAPFECVGIQHSQDEVSKAITIDQNHYVSQLRPISSALLTGKSDEELVDCTLQGLYWSLLGGVAWLTLTRADIAVFVGRFQRHSQKVTVGDIKGLNTLLKWIKRKPFSIKYVG
ncbi:unnamed protein product [Prorocentrum cordatum]|uniref:Integrase catalytic domain-containing protein n=1 Tax=Prorocentrum cordatum TaxID=2364126 RepID=A0ABN9SR24_9DINO|nr:unnamed protein product [Polarella glacialis]